MIFSLAENLQHFETRICVLLCNVVFLLKFLTLCIGHCTILGAKICKFSFSRAVFVANWEGNHVMRIVFAKCSDSNVSLVL